MRKHKRHRPRQGSIRVPMIGLFDFLSGTFTVNECFYDRYSRHHNQWTRVPLNDLEIAEKIVAHFPDQWRLLEVPIDKYYGFWPTVNYYRGRYNRGAFRHHPIPDRPSFRYQDGQRVSGRSGKKVLTPREIATILITHESRKMNRQDANHALLSRH